MPDWINPETLGVAVLAALIAHLVFIGLRWLLTYALGHWKSKTEWAKKGSREDVLRFMQDDRLLIIYATQAIRAEITYAVSIISGLILVYAVDLGGEHLVMAVFEEVLNWMGLAALAYASLSVVFRNLRRGRALALAQWYLEKAIDERSSVEESSEDAQGTDAEKGEDERGP